LPNFWPKAPCANQNAPAKQRKKKHALTNCALRDDLVEKVATASPWLWNVVLVLVDE
jgi:hypothetical protein